jgi:hypothetical protein
MALECLQLWAGLSIPELGSLIIRTRYNPLPVRGEGHWVNKIRMASKCSQLWTCLGIPALNSLIFRTWHDPLAVRGESHRLNLSGMALEGLQLFTPWSFYLWKDTQLTWPLVLKGLSDDAVCRGEYEARIVELMWSNLNNLYVL